MKLSWQKPQNNNTMDYLNDHEPKVNKIINSYIRRRKISKENIVNKQKEKERLEKLLPELRKKD